MSEFRCCPSVGAANPLQLERDLDALAQAGVDEFHFEIMDGEFVADIALGFEVMKAVKEHFGIHCNAQLMVARPDRHIARCIAAGADSVTIHVESSLHANRLLQQIRDLGASPGIALNPPTPLTRLEYLLPLVDRVCVMTNHPGERALKISPTAFERVRILRENLKYHNYRAKIQAAGGITAESAGRLAAVGAESFVLDAASIFRSDTHSLADRLAAFKKQAQLAKAIA